MKRRSYSAKERTEIWDRCSGENKFPVCNICGLSVVPGQAWDISHDPKGIPAALGGNEVGIAHRRCNRQHGAQTVTPLIAKLKRVRAKHIGARERGTGHRPLPCGRNSKWRKTLRGAVVLRNSALGGLSC